MLSIYFFIYFVLSGGSFFLLHRIGVQKLPHLTEEKTLAGLANQSFIACTLLVLCDFTSHRLGTDITTVNPITVKLIWKRYGVSLQRQHYWPSNQPPIWCLSQHRSLRENVGQSTAILMLLLVTIHLIHSAWLSLPKICLLPLCQNLPCHPWTQPSNWTRCGMWVHGHAGGTGLGMKYQRPARSEHPGPHLSSQVSGMWRVTVRLRAANKTALILHMVSFSVLVELEDWSKIDIVPFSSYAQ